MNYSKTDIQNVDLSMFFTLAIIPVRYDYVTITGWTTFTNLYNIYGENLCM